MSFSQRKRSPVRRIMRNRLSDVPNNDSKSANNELGDRFSPSSPFSFQTSSSISSTPKTPVFRDRHHHHHHERNGRKKKKTNVSTDIYGNEYVSMNPTTTLKREKNDSSLCDELKESSYLGLTQQQSTTSCESIFEKYCAALGLSHDLQINYKTEKCAQMIQYEVEYYSGSFFWESVQGDFLSKEPLSREHAFSKALQQISTKFWVELKHILGTEFVPTHKVNSNNTLSTVPSSSFCDTQQEQNTTSSSSRTETSPWISTSNPVKSCDIWPPLPKDPPPPPPPSLPQNCSTTPIDNSKNIFLLGNSISPWLYNYNTNHYPFIPPLPPNSLPPLPPPPPPPPPPPLENEQEEKSNTDPIQCTDSFDNLSTHQQCNIVSTDHSLRPSLLGAPPSLPEQELSKANVNLITNTSNTTTTTTMTIQPQNKGEQTKEWFPCKKVENQVEKQDKQSKDEREYFEEYEDYEETEEDYNNYESDEDDNNYETRFGSLEFGMGWSNSGCNSSPIPKSPISQSSTHNKTSLYESLYDSKYLPETSQIKSPIAIDFRKRDNLVSYTNYHNNNNNTNNFTMSRTTTLTSNASYNTCNNNSANTKIEYSAKPVLYKKQQQ